MSKFETTVQRLALVLCLLSVVPAHAQVKTGGSGDPAGGAHLSGVSEEKLDDLKMAEEHELEDAVPFNLLDEPAYKNIAFPKLKQFEQSMPWTGGDLRAATFKKNWWLTKRDINCEYISTTIAEKKIPFACQNSVDIWVREQVYRDPRVTDATRAYMIVHEIVREWTSTMRNNALHKDDAIRLIARTIMGSQTDKELASLVRTLQGMKSDMGNFASISGSSPGFDLNIFKSPNISVNFIDYTNAKTNRLINDLYTNYCNSSNEKILEAAKEQETMIFNLLSDTDRFIRYTKNLQAENIVNWVLFRNDGANAAFDLIFIKALFSLSTPPLSGSTQDFFSKATDSLKRRGAFILSPKLLSTKNSVFFQMKIAESFIDSQKGETAEKLMRELGNNDAKSLNQSDIDYINGLFPELEMIQKEIQLKQISIEMKRVGSYSKRELAFTIYYSNAIQECSQAEQHRTSYLEILDMLKPFDSISYCNPLGNSYDPIFIPLNFPYSNRGSSNRAILTRLFQGDGRRKLNKTQICEEVSGYIQKMNSTDPFYSDHHHIAEWMRLAE